MSGCARAISSWTKPWKAGDVTSSPPLQSDLFPALYHELHDAAQALFPQLVAWRRDFHAHPELGYQEVRTAGIVAEHLRSLGLEVTTGVGKTGVVAILEGDDVEADAPTVLLRFDMDALPIHEQNDVSYRSQHDGVMHACGHDGHTAMGMGVARLLADARSRIRGRVKLVFQPAEAGLGGAATMIEDGALHELVPQTAFSLHLWSRLPLNQVVVQSGPLWAGCGFFTLAVKGQGGHGAAPHETVDATLVASQIVVAWQSIVARNVDPAQTAVVTVGTFQSGDQNNIVSGEAILTGTIRYYDSDVEALVKTRMAELAEHIGRAFGATCTLSFGLSVPATINSPAGADLMRPIAEAIVGPEQVAQIPPMMVGEDFAEFLQHAPGCLILIGASDPEQGWHSPHHSATFDFDERMLPTGTAIMAGAALTYLWQQSAS
jgi:amidohydrolase